MTISRQASGATINLRWNKRSLWKHLTSVTKNADNFTTQISLRGISKNIFSDLEKRLINNIWTHLVIYGLKYGLENISRPIMGGVVAWVEWETWSDLSVLSGELHGHRRPSVSPSATNVFYYDIALKSQIIPVKGRSFPSEIWMRAVSLSLYFSRSLNLVFISSLDGVLFLRHFPSLFVDFSNAFLWWLNFFLSLEKVSCSIPPWYPTHRYPFVLSFPCFPLFNIRICPAFFVRSVSYLAFIVVYHLRFLISILCKQRMHTKRGNMSLMCTINDN